MAEYIDIDAQVVVTDTRGRERETTVRHILEMNKGVYTAADVVERKTGKWILSQDVEYEYCTCSECGYDTGENWMIGSKIPYCEMCGSYNGGDENV